MKHELTATTGVDVTALRDLGASMATQLDVTIDGDSSPLFIVPEGYKIESIDQHLLYPTRKRGIASFTDAQSFCAYVKKHGHAAEVLDSGYELYGNTDQGKFTAVFNPHGANNPDWGDHKAVFNLSESVEWKRWIASNGKKMDQETFARFIEDNLPDIVSPPGADMLEISRTLEAKKSVNFAQATRLNNGQTELQYEEEVRGTAGKGLLSIPDMFVLGIRVFDGGEKFRVDARLRYRILEGTKSLSMWYDLLRPHKVEEAAFQDVRTSIELELTKQAMMGVPI